MARWEPNARERLEHAALALFAERGYDAATVTEIAERAGLAKSTFFRHFADKREVLFGEPGALGDLLAAAIRDAPPAATLPERLAAALSAVAAFAFPPERHERARQRRAVIAASAELRERDLLKREHLAAAMADALRPHAPDDATASVAGQLGVLAFTASYAAWADSDGTRPYAEIAHAALRDLLAAAASLGPLP